MNEQSQNESLQNTNTTFEAAFARLESILEKMNSSAISLDEALKLYEEADALIHTCNKRLGDAEKKIEILVKNRNGELALGPDQRPSTQDFHVPGNNQQRH